MEEEPWVSNNDRAVGVRVENGDTPLDIERALRTRYDRQDLRLTFYRENRYGEYENMMEKWGELQDDMTLYAFFSNLQ